MMKKRARRKSSIFGTGSRKRPKPNYSDRACPPEEWERLAATHPRFQEATPGYWPIEEVLAHRRNPNNNTLRYQVQWVDHPVTGEVWRPVWVSADDITEDVTEAYWAKRNAKIQEKEEKRKTTPDQALVKSGKGAESNPPTRRSARFVSRQAGEQPEDPPPEQTSAPRALSGSSSAPAARPGQPGTGPPDDSQFVIDFTPFLPEGASDLSSPPASNPDQGSESEPESESGKTEGKQDPGRAYGLDAEPDPASDPHRDSEANDEPEWASAPVFDPGSRSESESDSRRTSVPDLGSGIEPDSAPALEPERELEIRLRPEFESIAQPDSILEAQQQAARTPSRSDGDGPSETQAFIPQEPSASSTASPLSSIPPGLFDSDQERGGEPAPEQDRGLSVGQTEATHSLARAVPSPRPSAPRVPVASPTVSPITSPHRTSTRHSVEPPPVDNTFVKEPAVNSARPSSVPRPVLSEVEPRHLSPEESTPARGGFGNFFDRSYRPAFLTKKYIPRGSTLGLSSDSDAMDPPMSSILNSPGMETPDPRMAPGGAGDTSIYDVALGSTLPIQDSIEDEEPTSNGEQFSSDSKASSSQQSVDNERYVPQVAGLAPPSVPILGPAEYALALPCEGKIQSTYSDIIKAKEKSIKKFLSRHESVDSAIGSPARTQERNEMNELVQQLHDTVTHMDLGLPGMPTQYPDEMPEHGTYASYAGTKFSFLGHLVDMLKKIGCSIVVMAREGPVQDLLENYLKVKNVAVMRQDRMVRSKPGIPDRISTDFQVELVSTWSTHQVAIYNRPILMIAFDSSFDSQDPQVARIRSHFSDRQPALMPVLHLLVENSSEHVDRCLPKSMPSPMRLRALVRATYQAWPNLGRPPTVIRRTSDEPEGRPMDFADLQRAVRKTLERMLVMYASTVSQAAISPDFDAIWNPQKPSLMPPLQLTEFAETPAKRSGVNTRAETPREVLTRSRTPLSRSDTPSGRKRMLDADGFLPALQKRQRLTPLRDATEASSRSDTTNQLAPLQDRLKKLEAELELERTMRQKAERDREDAYEQLAQWKQDHAHLQRRYEKRMTKCHELERQNKKILKSLENNKMRNERIAEDDRALKQKNAELQKELDAARAEIKAGGGDAAALESAREEARNLFTKSSALEKSLENTRKDFNFTRTQYQEASNKAAEFANLVRDLEEQVASLSKQAGDEKRRLKITNYRDSIEQHLSKITELELECKSRETLIRKLEEENRHLKRNRGIQTRGSSVQPPGSPGLDGGHSGRGTRSRQGSPAPGLFVNSHHTSAASRGSLLRHER